MCIYIFFLITLEYRTDSDLNSDYNSVFRGFVFCYVFAETEAGLPDRSGEADGEVGKGFDAAGEDDVRGARKNFLHAVAHGLVGWPGKKNRDVT